MGAPCVFKHQAHFAGGVASGVNVELHWKTLRSAEG